MRLDEAYKTLEIDNSASQEDIKKKYRKMAKEFHPDVNKSENSEEKFKKINEAYQVLSNKNNHTDSSNEDNDFPFGDMHFARGRQTPVENIILNTTLSFKESILGCQREVSFTRNSKCKNCNGLGKYTLNNGCNKCGGRGVIVGSNGPNSFFTATCSQCRGVVQKQQCNTCSASGVVNTTTTLKVNIPGGVNNENILRLHGCGNYAGSILGNDQYSEAMLYLNVIPEDNMRLEGEDVVSILEVPLVGAIVGGSHVVKTIFGETTVELPKLSRHKDEVLIPKHGVNEMGNHRVILNVNYPENIINIINDLNAEGE